MPGQQQPSRDATACRGATCYGEAEGGDGSTMHQSLAEARHGARQALPGGHRNGFLIRAEGYGGHAGHAAGGGEGSSVGVRVRCGLRPHDPMRHADGVTRMDGPKGR